jgi:two-component system, cell cycle sensor histidine kinase and response regulator CckA
MTNSPIKILLVEDNIGDVRLLQENLKEVNSIQFQLTAVEWLRDALVCLAQEQFDIILLDLSLPDSHGLNSFNRVVRQNATIPVVVLTGSDDESMAIEAMQAGVQDYLIKGQVTGDLLIRSIRYAIERKQTEQKLRQQAALLDITTDAMLVRDLEQNILYWNLGAEKLYGWSQAEAVGKNVLELLKPYSSIDLSAQEILQIALSEGFWQGELEKKTKSGRTKIVNSRWTLMSSPQQPTSILSVDTDITEKKKLEAQFLRAQRMESLGTLASGIAHDLNNILTPILAVAQLLPKKLTKLDDRARNMLKILEENAKRGSELVKQILAFARGVEGKHIDLQVGHLLWEVIRVAKHTFPKSIEIEATIPTRDLHTVSADATQLQQVFMNLIVNARDAMPNGGKLTLYADNCHLDKTYARLHLDARVGNYIVVTVADTGMGIAPELQDRIFEPFFTTKEQGKGTGLGLSTVLGIVKSHGGFINVYSEVGKGTEFKVYLPSIEPKIAGDTPKTVPLKGKNELILIVDDEVAIRQITTASLEGYKYRVLVAKDGIEAIALYAEHKAEISLVLLDLMMPNLDSPTIVRTLKQLDPKIKIIAMSGLAANESVAKSLNREISAFLAKPFTIEELLNTVFNVLHGASNQ